jgi:hypothetical protein
MMRSPKVRVLASGGGSRPRLAAAPLIFFASSIDPKICVPIAAMGEP